MNDLKSENGVKSFMKIKFFAFLVDTFQFSVVYETSQNMANATMREVWAWHSRSKMHKITGKFGMKFYKLDFLWLNNQII